ncbi:MAG: GGDEF domain-containing protein [Ruminococcus flavefaciens]|nr:GGDEF domain-containing protein [Ruminococcus flavefaciens]MCM1230546.1 GGDEF domain-containing protein [Ruminococcus flavefaciens]
MNLGKVVNIAVFVAGLDEEYQNNIIVGINDFARRNNVNVSYFAAFGGMIDSKLFDIGEYSIYDLANLEKFDGAILMTNTINDDDAKGKVISRIKESGIPAVVFDCDDFSEFYNISINNTIAMREMVRHVIQKHNAKVINYISGPMSNPEAVDRLEAFREVMAENNLEVDEERIYYGEFRTFDGRDAIEKYMKSGKPLPDAFICANDAMALTAVSALEKYGFCIPLDVIVTGFDYTYNARNFCPALTTVKRPLSQMGSYACGVVLDLIDGKKPANNELEASCVFTESCGCEMQTPDNYSEYRKVTYNKIEKTNSNIQKLNILAARLAETELAEEHFEVIRNFVSELDCEKFVLCLKSNWLETYNSSMPDYDLFDSMTAPLIWSEEKTESVEYFKGSEMNPSPLKTGGNISYYLPLHFRNKVLGYYIVVNGDFPIDSLLCHTFSMNVSHSIENIRKLSHINKAMDELNRIYIIDPLCDIYNRNGFIKFVDETFKDCVKNNKKIMITFIDMDGLKFINDNYGHDEGDFAIKHLAGVIKECCRPGEICARFGGDEFVMFDSSASDSSADSLARRFNAKLESINSIINKPYKISASLGSYVAKVDENDTLYRIIKQADELMYEVKKNKRNSRAGSEKK